MAKNKVPFRVTAEEVGVAFHKSLVQRIGKMSWRYKWFVGQPLYRRVALFQDKWNVYALKKPVERESCAQIKTEILLLKCYLHGVAGRMGYRPGELESEFEPLEVVVNREIERINRNNRNNRKKVAAGAGVS